MSEIRVIVRFTARRGKEEQLRALLLGMVDFARAEPGCELYELYEPEPGPRRLLYLYETWRSQAGFDRYRATPRYQRFEQTVRELIDEPFDVWASPF
jgi:quinol monooxygenase YgiN